MAQSAYKGYKASLAVAQPVWRLPVVAFFLSALVFVTACGQSVPADYPPTYVAPSGTSTSIDTPTSGYAFRPAACVFTPPVTEDVACGWLTVPEYRTGVGGAGGQSISLHVAVFKSHSSDPDPDPLIVLGGGPGQDTIDALLELVPKMGPVLARRDIVVFDQRGAGYSRPSLDCSETDLARCRDRLTRQGVDLAAYTNNANAADLNDLRLALGFDKVNLYGGSYGTLLGLTVLRHYPEGVRSVVLDSVVPPQVSLDVEEARLFEQSLNALFEACAADQPCSAAYPDLRDAFLDTVVHLDSRPAMITMQDPETRAEFAAALSGSAFAYQVWHFMRFTEALPYLPNLIYSAHRGNFGPLTEVLRRLAASPIGTSEGAHLCVWCSSMTPFESDEALHEVVAGLNPALAEAVTGRMWQEHSSCRLWPMPVAGPEEREPVRSDVPALLLSGQFDPLTPPVLAEAAAATLENHYSHVFPATGHAVIISSDCAWQMMGEFVDNPAVPPGSGCIGRMPQLEFVLAP